MLQKMHIIRDLAVVSSCISIGYKHNIFALPILTKKSHWAQKFSYFFVRKNNFLKNGVPKINGHTIFGVLFKFFVYAKSWVSIVKHR